MSSTPILPPDERRPLLESNNAVDEENVLDASTKRPILRLVRWICYATSLILLSIALGFFIKAFIDSGDAHFDWKGALQVAIDSGLGGAAAMALLVIILMPLRTVMNYQYRNGTTATEAFPNLYEDGGWKRFYYGFAVALVQAPISRFGDTASSAGTLALLESNSFMKQTPGPVKMMIASVGAAAFRMILTPIDTAKTTLQTMGKGGMTSLTNRIQANGVGTLWQGTVATAAATFVGHYPWFGTYNYLDAHLPQPHTTLEKVLRYALIGLVASLLSDTLSNSLRVVKAQKQVNETHIGHVEAARTVIAADGLRGLFGRGLKTRLMVNGVQGPMFVVLWKTFMDLGRKTQN